jgi:hypothetical protein
MAWVIVGLDNSNHSKNEFNKSKNNITCAPIAKIGENLKKYFQVFVCILVYL